MKRRTFLQAVSAGMSSFLGLNKPKRLAQETIVLEDPEIYKKMNMSNRQGNSIQAEFLRMKERFLTIEKVHYVDGVKIVRRIPFTMNMYSKSTLKRNRGFINLYLDIKKEMKNNLKTKQSLYKTFDSMRSIIQYAQTAYDSGHWDNEPEVKQEIEESFSRCVPAETLSFYRNSFEDLKDSIDILIS